MKCPNGKRFHDIILCARGEEDDEFITKVAENIEEALPLIEAGFIEAVDYNGVKVFKIRKSRLGRVS